MTSKNEISAWFDQGKKNKATHMIVVCDTFDYEDYPVYAYSDAEALAKHAVHNGPNMQRVMEVYDLRMDKTLQMEYGRAMSLPKKEAT
jgi:hypothetical protein